MVFVCFFVIRRGYMEVGKRFGLGFLWVGGRREGVVFFS